MIEIKPDRYYDLLQDINSIDINDKSITKNGTILVCTLPHYSESLYKGIRLPNIDRAEWGSNNNELFGNKLDSIISKGAYIEYLIYKSGNTLNSPDYRSKTKEWGNTDDRYIDIDLSDKSLIVMNIVKEPGIVNYIWDGDTYAKILQTLGYKVSADHNAALGNINTGNFVKIYTNNSVKVCSPKDFVIDKKIIDGGGSIPITSFKAEVTESYERTGETYKKPIYSTRDVYIYKTLLGIKIKVGTERYISDYETAHVYDYYYYDKWDGKNPFAINKTYYAEDVSWNTAFVNESQNAIIIPESQKIDKNDNYLNIFIEKNAYNNKTFNEMLKQSNINRNSTPIFVVERDGSIKAMTDADTVMISKAGFESSRSYSDGFTSIESIRAYLDDFIDYEDSFTTALSQINDICKVKELYTYDLSNINNKLKAYSNEHDLQSSLETLCNRANDLYSIYQYSNSTLEFIINHIKKEKRYIKSTDPARANTYRNVDFFDAFKNTFMEMSFSFNTQTNRYDLVIRNKINDSFIEFGACSRFTFGNPQIQYATITVTNIDVEEKHATWYDENNISNTKTYHDDFITIKNNYDTNTLAIKVQPDFTSTCKHRGEPPTQESIHTDRDKFKVEATFS